MAWVCGHVRLFLLQLHEVILLDFTNRHAHALSFPQAGRFDQFAVCKCGEWDVELNDYFANNEDTLDDATLRRRAINDWQLNHVRVVVGSTYKVAHTRPDNFSS